MSSVKIFGARTLEQPSFKHPAPGYVRYQRPPVVEPIEPLILDSGERLEGQIKYYDYGVLSVVFELPFSGDWDTLVQMGSRWVWDVDFEKHASRIARQKLERAAPALVKPYSEWLSEDYFIFHVREIAGSPSASELCASQGGSHRANRAGRNRPAFRRRAQRDSSVAHFLLPQRSGGNRLERRLPLRHEAGAETAIQLLEYANSQLLEFRHYDELLTRELGIVYAGLDKGTGMLARWRLARAATKLHTVLLDVNELTERADNAIKFLSDMFSARLYKLAAAKVGVPDYKDLVTQKLQTAEDLYRFMVDQFNQSRAFVLELMVVIILVIELVFFFGGKVVKTKSQARSVPARCGVDPSFTLCLRDSGSGFAWIVIDERPALC